jgi:hypothetical protein
MSYKLTQNDETLSIVNNENGETVFSFLPDSGLLYAISPKTGLTKDGGLAVKLTNKTGSDSVRGYCVTSTSAADNAVALVPVGVPNCIGVFLESGVADGEEAWVVVSGVAEVYFWDSTTRGQLARTGIASDTGEISGQALSEAIPEAPFATDKHFCEIGHVLETRTGAGLAKCVLHFN